MARLPLAEAVLTLWRWAADTDTVNQIFDDNRGRCYEKILLLDHRLPGPRRLARIRRQRQTELRGRPGPRRVGRLGPCGLWQAGADPDPGELRLPGGVYGTVQRHLPQNPTAQTPLPKSLDEYEVVVLDGKAIKRVAKRLKRVGRRGGVLGGRALVA